MSASSRLSVSERALARVGTIVQQKYRIVRLIGIGGMAAVYGATDPNGHPVAIKFILESATAARAAAKIVRPARSRGTPTLPRRG